MTKKQLHHLMDSMRDFKKEFDLLVEPHRPALWRYCKMITGSPWDAEDLVQETLLKTYSALPRIFQPLIPKAYLFRIATNTWLNHQRKQKQLMLDENTEGLYEDNDPFEMREAMEKLVVHLSPKQRAVILLFDVFDFHGKEVAEMIGTTEGAVKALLQRARANLKKVNQEGEKMNTISNDHVKSSIIDAYLDAFNRRDPDAIAELMDESAVNDIVHTSYEYGKETIRKHSLEGWRHDPMPMTATYKELWGKPVVVVMTKKDGKEAVYSLIELEVENHLIVSKRTYYFCQDLLQAVADELNVPAHLNGYIYMGE